MFNWLFGPVHTLGETLQVLEEGLRSGDITLGEDCDPGNEPVIERVTFQRSAVVSVGDRTFTLTGLRWREPPKKS